MSIEGMNIDIDDVAIDTEATSTLRGRQRGNPQDMSTRNVRS